jgi:tripartite-type tricarboxylate transporter receptor subunit TctC
LIRILAATLALISTTAFGQPYPNQPIKVVVPFTPGTSMDLIARTLGPHLTKRIGQPVVIDNRPGATGMIGGNLVAKAPADGYTLLVTSNNIVVAPHLYKSVPFNPHTDLAPITLTSYSAMTLTASLKSEIRSVAELIAAAKANPGKLNYSSPGIGTTQHISMESLKDVAGIQLVHIPYKGSAGALTDLLNGEISVGFVPIDLAMVHIRSGGLKVLAVGSPARQAMLPDVPTLEEGGIPGVVSNPWHALLAPKGTPQAIVTLLNSEVRAILELPEVKRSLEGQGLKVETGTPGELQSLMERESTNAARIIRKHGISID